MGRVRSGVARRAVVVAAAESEPTEEPRQLLTPAVVAAAAGPINTTYPTTAREAQVASEAPAVRDAPVETENSLAVVAVPRVPETQECLRPGPHRMLRWGVEVAVASSSRGLHRQFSGPVVERETGAQLRRLRVGRTVAQVEQSMLSLRRA